MKKLISVMLSVVLVFSLTIPAFSAGVNSGNTDYDGTPVVIVRGIDFAGLTYPDGTKALNVSGSQIMSVLMEAFMGKFNIKDKHAVTNCVFEAANSILSPIACDNEGNSVENVSMVQYPGAVSNYPALIESLGDGSEPGIIKAAIERYGAENTYFFTYDWRKPPVVLAEELKGFVDTAKSDSGKDKVNIICCSMGCMVTTAYMYYYGSQSIETAVYLSGAQNGTYVCGDALNGRVGFDSDTLVALVNSTCEDNIFLRLFVWIFNAFGVMDFLTGILNDIVDTSFQDANDIVLRDCMGTLCGFWALCPDDDYDSALDTIFGGYEEQYPVLLEKLYETKEFVCSTEETLLAAKENGVKLAFASHYDLGLVPVYDRANYNGDMVLETELTSNFATVAPLGETLSEEYLENADRSYVSADRVIDASTALFPEYTWFIKDAPHVASDYGTDYSDFTFTLLESEAQPTVDMFEEYPRFMTADDELNLTKMG